MCVNHSFNATVDVQNLPYIRVLEPNNILQKEYLAHQGNLCHEFKGSVESVTNSMNGCGFVCELSCITHC